MQHLLRCILLAGVLVGGTGFGAEMSRAQEEAEGRALRTADTVGNLFATIDASRPLAALQIRLPSGATLVDARLLRYGTEPVRTTLTREGGDVVRLELASPGRGPHELVLRVTMPASAGRYSWTVTPVVQGRGGASERAEGASRRHRIKVQAEAEPDGGNRVLSMAEASRSLGLRADAVPALGGSASFTVEFWMRTSGLDEVVLSSWTGAEAVPYPLELMVDRSGRVRFYCGEPGNHRALRSEVPVADGHWHHVAVVYDAAARRVRLLLDGAAVDSMTNVRVPSGREALSIGGRVRTAGDGDEAGPSRYTGALDELRIWPVARSAATVRRMRHRPLSHYRQEGKADGPEKGLHLGFETDPDALLEGSRTGARRIPSTLSFQSSLRSLRARTEGRSVTLRWAGEATEEGTFVVERSAEGTRFEPVARLDPAEVRKEETADGPTYTFTDTDVPGRIVYYRIRQRYEGGTERTSSTVKIGLGSTADTSRAVQLVGNFPNPFSETTTIAFEVREPTPVTISVWNLTAHRVAEITDRRYEAGYHEHAFDGTNLPSGTYFVRLNTPGGQQSHRMVVLK